MLTTIPFSGVEGQPRVERSFSAKEYKLISIVSIVLPSCEELWCSVLSVKIIFGSRGGDYNPFKALTAVLTRLWSGLALMAEVLRVDEWSLANRRCKRSRCIDNRGSSFPPKAVTVMKYRVYFFATRKVCAQKSSNANDKTTVNRTTTNRHAAEQDKDTPPLAEFTRCRRSYQHPRAR